MYPFLRSGLVFCISGETSYFGTSYNPVFASLDFAPAVPDSGVLRALRGAAATDRPLMGHLVLASLALHNVRVGKGCHQEAGEGTVLTDFSLKNA